ncbi:hypothetical protein [Companilactobacillus sp. HBUAS56275]|uniref:Uncharacterized protein n=1 Tax=Candidatus Companilactobacillus pullicola TaxID=2838523 RepID=A0A9D1ZME7_9LACO|nr:hypothetical protein [Candidatus Companilactobacillus pullicola]
MFYDFLILTLKFGILSFLPMILAIVFDKKHTAFYVGLQLIIFLIQYLYVFIFLPGAYLYNIIFYNLINLLLCTIIFGLLFLIFSPNKVSVRSAHGGSTVNLKYIAKPGFGIILALVIVVALGTIVNMGPFAKAIAKTTNVQQSQQVKDAPMPVISSSKKEVPVVNSNKTVSSQLQNSLSNVKNSNVYSLNHLRVQFYHGKLVYIAPLDFEGDFFRYVHYKKVPGYFIVDATSKNSHPKFVKKDMAYTPSAYFGHDVNRRIYSAIKGSNLVLTGGDAQLEIDEKGKPYYVKTLYKTYGITRSPNYKKTWLGMVDAETGKTRIIEQKNAPKWLDVTFDPGIASSKVESFSSDRNGWWNAHGIGGSRTGVMEAVDDVGTEGVNKEFTPISYKGQVYYFASMTSKNKKQTSVLGYIYVNARNGKTYFYREKEDAMTPNRAKSLAENRMKQTQWKASMPLLYRIDGKPTWIVSMIDSNGAFMSYVYLLANGNGTQSSVSVGNDAKTTLTKYRALVSNGLTTASSSDTSVEKTFSGTVKRAVIDGDNIIFLLTNSDKVFYASSKNDSKNIFVRDGDNVKFSGSVSGNTVNISSSVTISGLDDK